MRMPFYFAAFALLLTTGLATPAIAATPTDKPALTVSVSQPQQENLPVRLAANGTVSAWQEAIIGAEVNGLRLSEILVNVGDTVRKGQLLARFSDETPQAELAQARAALQEAQAQGAQATSTANRARALKDSGALSQQQIDESLAAEKVALARIASASAALKAQEVRTAHTQVLAPDSGVISARSATLGSVANNGTELFRLIRQGRLEWRAEVTGHELNRIRLGMPVLITSPNGQQLTGKVRALAPSINTQTRTALVYVDVPTRGANGAAPLVAGMFASGTFEVGQSTALTVPQQAVVVRDGFDYVFVLGSDQRVNQVKVKTGQRLGNKVAIVQGLNAQSPVVEQGAAFLNQGDKVKVVSK